MIYLKKIVSFFAGPGQKKKYFNRNAVFGKMANANLTIILAHFLTKP